MIAVLRKKAQLTIPGSIIKKLGLSEGDRFEVFEKDGEIHLVPVVVYPKQYLYDLKEEFTDTKNRLALGEEVAFDSIDSLFEYLDKPSEE